MRAGLIADLVIGPALAFDAIAGVRITPTPVMRIIAALRRLTIVTFGLASALSVFAANLPFIPEVESQPLFAQVRRLLDATNYLGAPPRPADQPRLVQGCG